MKTLSDYSVQIGIKATPKKVFLALNTGLDSWWGKISNDDFSLDGEFTITFDNGYWWTFKIVEYRPNTELIWRCVAGEPEFNKEWIGHVLHWKISTKDSKTLIDFQQTGLTPQLHCYEVCSATWEMFLKDKLIQYLEIRNEKKEPSWG